MKVKQKEITDKFLNKIFKRRKGRIVNKDKTPYYNWPGVKHPNSLSPIVLRNIVELTRQGLPITSIAAAVGTGFSTLSRWKEKGEKIIKEIEELLEKGEDIPKLMTENPYYLLIVLCEKAKAEFERDHLKNIDLTARGKHHSIEVKREFNVKGLKIREIITKKKWAPNWKASAWLMERRFPEIWGGPKNEGINVSANSSAIAHASSETGKIGVCVIPGKMNEEEWIKEYGEEGEEENGE